MVLCGIVPILGRLAHSVLCSDHCCSRSSLSSFVLCALGVLVFVLLAICTVLYCSSSCIVLFLLGPGILLPLPLLLCVLALNLLALCPVLYCNTSYLVLFLLGPGVLLVLLLLPLPLLLGVLVLVLAQVGFYLVL